MSTDPTAVIEGYLAVVSDLDADAGSLAAFVHPDARFTERPNIVAPGGRSRDAACAAAAFGHSRRLLRENRLDVQARGRGRARRHPRDLDRGPRHRRGPDPGRYRDARGVLHVLHRPATA